MTDYRWIRVDWLVNCLVSLDLLIGGFGFEINIQVSMRRRRGVGRKICLSIFFEFFFHRSSHEKVAQGNRARIVSIILLVPVPRSRQIYEQYPKNDFLSVQFMNLSDLSISDV